MTTNTNERGRIRIEDSPKHVRAYLGGELIIDSKQVKLVWEVPYYPTYYFPRQDVRTELLTPTDHQKKSPSRGVAQFYDVKGGTQESANAAYEYPESPIPELRGLIAFRWKALDHWFEENEEVFVHPRDPYTRLDILPSARHVEVEINGVKVADSTNTLLLFETGLPTRYYIPKPDVRLDLMTPTNSETQCPYKGTAQYWSVEAGGEVFEDIMWSYPAPLPESQRIGGYVSFYNERVDITIDGERQERPKTKFS